MVDFLDVSAFRLGEEHEEEPAKKVGSSLYSEILAQYGQYDVPTSPYTVYDGTDLYLERSSYPADISIYGADSLIGGIGPEYMVGYAPEWNAGNDVSINLRASSPRLIEIPLGLPENRMRTSTNERIYAMLPRIFFNPSVSLAFRFYAPETIDVSQPVSIAFDLIGDIPEDCLFNLVWMNLSEQQSDRTINARLPSSLAEIRRLRFEMRLTELLQGSLLALRLSFTTLLHRSIGVLGATFTYTPYDQF